MNKYDLSFLTWINEEDFKEFENNINEDFDKGELKDLRDKILRISNILNNRINDINDEINLVYTAHISFFKEGNTKYIHFGVSRQNKYIDIYGNIEYKPTSYLKDMLIENVEIKYKKTDKKTIKQIEEFKIHIINTYEIDNKEKFINDYIEIMS